MNVGETQQVLAEQLHELLQCVLNTKDDLREVNLVESGRMDSLALVSLMLELETTFDITIDYERLDTSDFANLVTLVQFVKTQRDTL